MVALPSIPERFVTTDAAKSSVTAGDVSAPYTMLGRALDTFGDGLEKQAVAQGEQEGHKAVTTDAGGNLQVQQMPALTGAAGKAFNRVAQQSYAIQVENKAREEVQKAQIQHDGNPAAFKAWADTYVETLATKQPNPALQDTIRGTVSRLATGTYDGMLARRHNLDLQTANVAIDSKIKSLGEEMQGLALQSGADTPEMAEKMRDFNHFLDEKVKNPLLAFPQEKAALISDTVMTQVYGAAVINGTQKVYETQGFEAARKHLRESVDALGTKIKTSGTIFNQGMSWLKSEEAGFRGERDALSREWSAAKPQAETLPRESLMDMRDRARAVGNVRVEQDISVNLAALDAVNTLRNLPASERAAVAATGKVDAPETILGARIGDPKRAVGLSTGFSGGLSQAITDYEKESGQRVKLNSLKRSTEEQAAIYERYKRGEVALAAAPGTSRHEVGEAADIPDGPFLKWMHANASRYGLEFLSGDSFKKDPGHVQLARSGPPVGQSEAGNIDLSARPTVKNADGTISTVRSMSFNEDGKEVLIPTVAADGSRILSDEEAVEQYRKSGKHLGKFDTPQNATAYAERLHNDQARQYSGGRSTDLTQSRTGLVALGWLKKELAKDTTQRISDLRTALGRQEVPDIGAVGDLSALVNAVGTPQQKRDVAELQATAEQGAKFRELKPDQRAAVVSAYQERGKAGGGRFEGELAAALSKADSQINDTYKVDPYGAAYRYNEGVKTLPPIDWAKPDEAGAILKAKSQQQAQIRADQDLGAFSILRPAEAQALKAQLTQGDGAQAGQVLGSLSRLPQDIYHATLSSDPIKAALDGMVRSYDPVKLNVAMTTLDQFYRADPLGFAKTYGEATFKRLQDWQAHRDSLTPGQMAERFMKADDPATIKARDALGDQFDKKAKDISVEKVSNALGSWADRNVPFVNQTPPVDAIQAGTMLAEFTAMAKERFIETGDMEKAQQQAGERLRTVWGPSTVAGGALMKYPPERFYPAVGASHDWMAKDVEKAIEQQVGKPQFETVAGVGPGTSEARLARNWSYKLMADQQTESDAKLGRPPSYVVQIVDKNGRMEIPTGANGKPMRYRFDPSGPQSSARAEFERRIFGDFSQRTDLPGFPAGMP